MSRLASAGYGRRWVCRVLHLKGSRFVCRFCLYGVKVQKGDVSMGIVGLGVVGMPLASWAVP